MNLGDLVTSMDQGTMDADELQAPSCFHLAWKLFTTPSQEAYCETLGSLMENYHKRRYTNTGSGNDDTGLQREMFCKARISEIQCLVVFTTLTSSRIEWSESYVILHF